jgi:hypothetical protein
MGMMRFTGFAAAAAITLMTTALMASLLARPVPQDIRGVWSSEYEIQLKRCISDPMACPGAQRADAEPRRAPASQRPRPVAAPALRTKPNAPQDAELLAASSRLAEVESWIDTNYPGGLAAFEFEVFRCFGRGGMHLLVLCSPSVVQTEPALWQAHRERETLMLRISAHEAGR